jgi:hypothetical protein
MGDGEEVGEGGVAHPALDDHHLPADFRQNRVRPADRNDREEREDTSDLRQEPQHQARPSIAAAASANGTSTTTTSAATSR